MQPDQRSPLDRQHAQRDVSKVGDGAGTGALPGQKKKGFFFHCYILEGGLAEAINTKTPLCHLYAQPRMEVNCTPTTAKVNRVISYLQQ